MSKQDLKTIQEWKKYAKEKGLSCADFKEFEKFTSRKGAKGVNQ